MIPAIHGTRGNEDDQGIYATPATYFDVDLHFGARHGRLLWKEIEAVLVLCSSEVKL